MSYESKSGLSNKEREPGSNNIVFGDIFLVPFSWGHTHLPAKVTRKKTGYFTVRLTVSVDPSPLTVSFL